MILFGRQGGPFAILLAGFVLWSVAFIVLYGMQGTGCSLGWQAVEVAGPVTLQRAVLVGLFLAFLAAHTVLYLKLRTPRRSQAEEDISGFARDAGETLALAALGASVFCFSGVLWLTAC